MLQALIDYLIEHVIGIIPRYVRSGHNFACDYLSRTDEDGIREWGERMKMTQRKLPDSCHRFCGKWKPVENGEDHAFLT